MISLQRFLKEQKRRLRSASRPLLDPTFRLQTDFINNPARLKVLFSTRRAAKSYTDGLHLIKDAQETPRVNCLYIGLTRDSAKKIMWKDVLKDINRKKNLKIKFNETLLTATLPNGSVIYLMGADSNEREKDKALGQKYKCVVIDEAASFRIDLRELVYGILKPATVDLGGTIILSGTSGNLVKGLFYDITTDKEPGWFVATWTAYDNPYVKDQWTEEIEDIKLNRPLFLETALYKQWYLNQWVIDDTKLVYKFSNTRNHYDALPKYSRGDWTYLLGVDLGYDDDSAFAVVAYHTFDRCLYIIEVFKKKGMDITDVANKIKYFQKRFEISRVVIDGSAKQSVKEIQNRHELALECADKTGKADFIEIMNSELIQGNIKLSALAGPLRDEYLALIWDDKSIKRQEHPSLPNHACDAALYVWRYCYQYISKMPDVKPKAGSSAWYEEQERLMLEGSMMAGSM